MPPRPSTPDRIQRFLSYFLRLTMVGGALTALFYFNFLVAFLAILALFLSFLPALFSRNFRILLPTEFELLFVVFIYASVFLGTAHRFYDRLWWWDSLLHGLSGIMLGMVGFIILFILYTRRKVETRPISLAFFSFCFAVALGTLWEIFEFAVDGFVPFPMQPSLTDTMADLILDCVGAFLIAFFGFLYVKYNREGMVKRLILRFVEWNPRFFRSWHRKQ